MPSTSHTSRSTVNNIIVNLDGDAADIFTDLLTGKKALLTSSLEFITTFSQVYTANQTNLSLITPTSGRLICVHGIVIATEANTGNVELDFVTSSKPVARLYATRFQQQTIFDVHIEGVIDEVLTLTTTTGNNDVFVAVSYIEED